MTTTSRRIVHAALVIASVPLWVVGCVGFAAAAAPILLAHRIWPQADRGNCWSFVGPRWLRHGGYLVVRPAGNVRIFGCPVPHAIWLRSMPAGADIEQTVPQRALGAAGDTRLDRVLLKMLHPGLLYFRFRVSRIERTPKQHKTPSA